MIKKQFTLILENRPGALAKVARNLSQENVNIEAISVAASADMSLVQILASNAAVTRRILKKQGISFSVQDVCLLPLKNEPGMLWKVVSGLAKNNININYIYATGNTLKSGAADDYIVISAPDLKEVEACWQKVSC
jgi:hypothetical protein